MEITQIETNLTDTRVELIEHQEKTQEFKNNVQEIFIDVFNQDEFSQKVDGLTKHSLAALEKWLVFLSAMRYFKFLSVGVIFPLD